MGKRRDEELLLCICKKRVPQQLFSFLYCFPTINIISTAPRPDCVFHRSFLFSFSYSHDYYHLQISRLPLMENEAPGYMCCVVCVRTFLFIPTPARASRAYYNIRIFNHRRASIYSWNVLFIYYMKRNIIRMRKLDYRQETYN